MSSIKLGCDIRTPSPSQSQIFAIRRLFYARMAADHGPSMPEPLASRCLLNCQISNLTPLAINFPPHKSWREIHFALEAFEQAREQHLRFAKPGDSLPLDNTGAIIDATSKAAGLEDPEIARTAILWAASREKDAIVKKLVENLRERRERENKSSEIQEQ